MAIRKSGTGLASLIAGLALLFAISGHALAEDTPSATVDLEEESLRLILGGESGEGKLHFKGDNIPFKLSGATVGGLGYSKLTAQGDVYGLKDAGDFAGNYVEGTAGITVGEGKGGVWMHNDKGVAMHLKTSSEGVELAIGAGGITVEMAE